MTKARSMFRAVGGGALRVGFVLGPAAFIFQIAQTWVYGYDVLPEDIFRWLVPLLLASTYGLVVIVIFASLARVRALKGPDGLLSDVVAYARDLAGQHKDINLIELSSAMGPFFHAHGANNERLVVGEFALQAAVRQHRFEDELSILVDDIGWTCHLAGDDIRAKHSIEAALSRIASVAQIDLTVRILKLSAKANRHLAIIVSSTDIARSRTLLQKAADNVRDAKLDRRSDELESAQIDHALALCITRSAQIVAKSPIAAGDMVTLNAANEALVHVMRSTQSFLNNGSIGKYAKSLYLEELLLRVTGRIAEADHAEVLFQDALRRSSWNPDELNANYRGVT